ncbi:unnamed protein product [Aphanomyces euteiches]|uniref:CS domain-containing protein n=1 Tax=Aphanomyces euteiches TaxID=100861 RepID=A0A6G0X0C9_9STRA|nr:hypothetical protein Ae201684_009814 [Aphanomyces euteiches]KAH9095872.1 hypothetical protein Ae201684P_010082 [Aphanomyces euteiches]
MTKYDAMLMGMAQQEGSIAGVLNAFFDFLHRNTDFYVVSENPQRRMGFAPGQAQELLLRSFKQFPMKPLEGNVSPSPSSSAPAPSAVSAPASTTAQTTGRSSTKSTTPQRTTAEGKQVPVGNGGTTSTYSWTQSLRDVTVQIQVPSGVKSKDMAVAFTHRTVSAGVKGQPPILHGTFPYKIKLEDTVWSFESSSQTLVLSIEKTVETWWRSVIEGDPEIDTSLVDSTQSIDEYDAETQGAIRKIMYEQQHKQQTEAIPSMTFPSSLNME